MSFGHGRMGAVPMLSGGKTYVHGIGECDKRLRSLPNFDPFHCKPPEFICACGRHWEHLCDEAEGCMYWEVTDFKRLMVER